MYLAKLILYEYGNRVLSYYLSGVIYYYISV